LHEPLAGCDLHPYGRVAVARIPPVMPYVRLDDGRLALMQNAGLPIALRFTVSSPCSTVNCSTRAGWRGSPMTRAPTSAVSSALARPAGLSQGRSRIVARLRVTGFSQTSPTSIGVRSGGPCGRPTSTIVVFDIPGQISSTPLCPALTRRAKLATPLRGWVHSLHSIGQCLKYVFTRTLHGPGQRATTLLMAERSSS
jgi:hypothetical protein